MRSILRLSTAGLLLLALLATAQAKGPAYDDPQMTDDDFAYQGEYVGEIDRDGEKQKIGVQVVAQGEGKFKAVAYLGGLPGAGWNGERHLAEGQKNDDGVVLLKGENDGPTAELKDGKIVVKHEGVTVVTLDKIERKSDTLGKKPPEGAVVLFDGSSADAFTNGKMTKDGLLMQGCTSKKTFGDHELHLEFRLPYQPQDRGQARGNSGIYVQGRYEVQMLDSFGLDGKQNECGGLYSVKDPNLNMCFPPLSWQTYDIRYRAARFDESGKLVSNPRITVRHNGMVIHDDVELPGERSTTAAPSKPGPEPGPVYLQDHGNPVRYRNIWVVETKNQ